MKKYLSIIVLVVIFCSIGTAQKITAQKIMQNLKEQFDSIEDYTVTLDIEPHIERFNTKQLKLRLFYKQPNKVHIESKGFVMIPRQLFESNPAQLLSKFDPILVETKKESSKTIYLLRLISKPEKNRPTMENYVTIDGNRWVILKLQAIPAEGRSIEILFDYMTVDNKYLLPSSMTASFNFGSEEDSVAKMKGFKGMPTKGTVLIKYSNYAVNSGLSDSLFEKDEKQKSAK
jgi:outer membrane lipoprotein-sorting protein